MSSSSEKNEDENELETPDHPRLELTLQVQFNRPDHGGQVGIGFELKGELRRQLIRFLKANKLKFAWTAEYMPWIGMNIASHEFNVDLNFKLVKQKRRKLGLY